MSIKLYIAGDSTAAQKLPEKRPESGWGEHLQPLLKNGVRVCNHAVNGRSSKSFIAEGRLSEIEALLQEGDWLIVQFGHNDEKKEDPARYTEANGAYKDNLKEFIKAAKKKRASVLILSSLTRRKFENGRLAPHTIGQYPKAAAELAKAEDAYFLDMYAASHRLINELGEDKSKELFLQLAVGESENYPDGVCDNTHFNYKGAEQMAGLFAQMLKESNCPLKEFLL